MEHQGGYVELLQILSEVRLRECPDTFIDALQAGLHAPQPELVEHALRDLRTGTIGAVEHNRQVFVKLRRILGETGAQAIEHLHRKSLRIGLRLDDDWRNGSDENHLLHTLGSVPPDIARDLASSGGVANE